MSKATAEATALNIAVLTVSDTRTRETDTSGDYLSEAVTAAGHTLAERHICIDNIYDIRAITSKWIADNDVHSIIITGGTGFSGRDSTPEAMTPLFDKSIDGYGELFRTLSFAEIGTSTIQSRACAGLANYTAIFCVPGSTGACKTALEGIIQSQLDSTQRPCNFVGHLLKRGQ